MASRGGKGGAKGSVVKTEPTPKETKKEDPGSEAVEDDEVESILSQWKDIISPEEISNEQLSMADARRTILEYLGMALDEFSECVTACGLACNPDDGKKIGALIARTVAAMVTSGREISWTEFVAYVVMMGASTEPRSKAASTLGHVMFPNLTVSMSANDAAKEARIAFSAKKDKAPKKQKIDILSDFATALGKAGICTGFRKARFAHSEMDVDEAGAKRQLDHNFVVLETASKTVEPGKLAAANLVSTAVSAAFYGKIFIKATKVKDPENPDKKVRRFIYNEPVGVFMGSALETLVKGSTPSKLTLGLREVPDLDDKNWTASKGLRAAYTFTTHIKVCMRGVSENTKRVGQITAFERLIKRFADFNCFGPEIAMQYLRSIRSKYDTDDERKSAIRERVLMEYFGLPLAKISTSDKNEASAEVDKLVETILSTPKRGPRA